MNIGAPGSFVRIDVVRSAMKRDRRALIIDAGMQLFSRYGYRDVGVDDIMERCGLSTGSFYQHFSGKEAFYESILTIMERDGIRLAERAVSRLNSPINKLKAIYRFVVLGVRQNPILRGVLLRDPRYIYPGMSTTDGPIHQLRSRIEELIAEVIHTGSRRGMFRPGLYHDASRLVIVMLDSLIARLDEPDVDALARDLLVMIQRGLRRVLRTRRKDERRDRRALQDELDPEWQQFPL